MYLKVSLIWLKYSFLKQVYEYKILLLLTYFIFVQSFLFYFGETILEYAMQTACFDSYFFVCFCCFGFIQLLLAFGIGIDLSAATFCYIKYLLDCELHVHRFVHHNINLIEITNKMRPCCRIYYSNLS
jgi:hypothetical protein